MGFFKDLINGLKAEYDEALSVTRAEWEKEEKFWNLIVNLDLSDKRIEYSTANCDRVIYTAYNTKIYRIYNSSGNCIRIICPEPRTNSYGYKVSYYKKIENSSFYPEYETICNLEILPDAFGIGDFQTMKSLVAKLERMKHSKHIDDMDDF